MCYLAYSRIACISSDVDTFFSLEFFLCTFISHKYIKRACDNSDHERKYERAVSLAVYASSEECLLHFCRLRSSLHRCHVPYCVYNI